MCGNHRGFSLIVFDKHKEFGKFCLTQNTLGVILVMTVMEGENCYHEVIKAFSYNCVQRSCSVNGRELFLLPQEAEESCVSALIPFTVTYYNCKLFLRDFPSLVCQKSLKKISCRKGGKLK